MVEVLRQSRNDPETPERELPPHPLTLITGPDHDEFPSYRQYVSRALLERLYGSIKMNDGHLKMKAIVVKNSDKFHTLICDRRHHALLLEDVFPEGKDEFQLNEWLHCVGRARVLTDLENCLIVSISTAMEQRLRDIGHGDIFHPMQTLQLKASNQFEVTKPRLDFKPASEYEMYLQSKLRRATLGSAQRRAFDQLQNSLEKVDEFLRTPFRSACLIQPPSRAIIGRGLRSPLHVDNVDKFLRSESVGGKLDPEWMLFEAAKMGEENLVRNLLHNGANHLLRGLEGYNLLQYMCSWEHGDVNTFSALVETGLSLHVYNADENLLHLACESDNAPMVRWLATRVPELVIGSYGNGETPLFISTREAEADLAEDMVTCAQGALRKDRYAVAFRTELSRCLLYAATERSEDIMRIMFQAGADWRSTEGSGRNALHLACYNACTNIVDKLLPVMAPVVNALDDRRRTPLTLAIRSKRPEGAYDIVRILLDHGADAHGPDGTVPPIVVAADFGRVDVLTLLLEHGADVSATDGAGNTALHAAAVRGRLEVVQLLVLKGANLTANNADGKTPSDLAKKAMHASVFEVLCTAKCATSNPLNY